MPRQGHLGFSNDPPAEPEALQLLAPQRVLIATVQNQNPVAVTLENNRQKHKQLGGIALPKMSNFYCHPGRAGGSPSRTSLLRRMGFEVMMTKASGDGGIDIVATLDQPLVGGRYLIQCKRFAAGNLVGAALVRQFYGAVTADRRAVKGILITTSDFTSQAKEFARPLPIELVGVTQLNKLLSEHGLLSAGPQGFRLFS